MFRIGVVAAIALALFVPASALSHGSANSASFVDLTGDSGAAGDISSVIVSNDDDGVVTFSIGLPNRTELLGPDFEQIFVNTDGSLTTGDHGFDVAIQVEWPTTRLFLYTGLGWNRARSNSVRSSFADGVLTASLALFDLRAVGNFDFFVYSGQDNGGVGKEDSAPDGEAGAPGSFYSSVIKVPLFFEHLDAPASVKLGKKLAASMFLVTDGVDQGTVTCTAKIGTSRIRGTPGWVNVPVTSPKDPNGTAPVEIGLEGDATCSFKVPKTTKSPVITATITATRSGVVVSRTFGATIR